MSLLTSRQSNSLQNTPQINMGKEINKSNNNETSDGKQQHAHILRALRAGLLFVTVMLREHSVIDFPDFPLSTADATHTQTCFYRQQTSISTHIRTVHAYTHTSLSTC